MRHAALEPIGIEISDLSIADLDATEVSTLKDLLATHGVLILRDQVVDDEGFVAFLRGFGELAFTKGEAHAPGAPDLNVVSNVGRTTPPRSVWHVDTSYVSQPPAYTALRAVEIPSEGGETLFTNQYRAYETLPDELVDRLRDRTIRHEVTGVTLEEGDEAAAEHPIFRAHPRSGATGLYITTPERCGAVSGIDDDEAHELIDRLFEHSTDSENVHRHRWLPGDVVMWDNGVVLHRGDHSAVVGDRVMHRGMVASY